MQHVVSLNAKHSGIKTPRKSFLFIKRTVDVLVSALMLVALLPILLPVALICALDTKGSPLFLQERMGKDGKPFKCVKFRTMSPEAPDNVATRDLEAEKYISSIGYCVRKLSLDELPQLWNILKGDMSFVGPRPIVLSETELLTLRHFHGADTVRPGMTGWSQINGRDNVRNAQKAFMDGYYARHATLLFDVKILFKTVWYVLRSRGVVEGRAVFATQESELASRQRTA